MRYRIVCTDQEPNYVKPKHARIIAVGTGTDPNAATERFTKDAVIEKIKKGDTFYTKGVNSGIIAEVEYYWCSDCFTNHIRSVPDNYTDNNLDNLRTCSWK